MLSLFCRRRAAVALPVLFSAFASLWVAAPAEGEGRVVVSIKPLHSIVQAVLGSSERAALLLDGGASVHGLALKPSQVRLLHQADVVFYIDDKLERFIAPVLRGRPPSVKMPLFRHAAKFLPLRTPHDHDHGDHDAHDDHGTHDDHDDHDMHEKLSDHDLHIWLDIENMQALARRISEVLSARKPQRRELYRQNAARLQQRLTALNADIARQLTPLANTPYAVMHDAYLYLEHAYGLRPPVILLRSLHMSPSVKQLRTVKRQLAAQNVRCMLREPQFPERIITALASEPGEQEGKIRVQTLDPLASTLPPGEELYFNLMRQTAAAMQKCLRP